MLSKNGMSLKDVKLVSLEPQPAAQALVNELAGEVLARCPAAAVLAARMKAETGTRFADWKSDDQYALLALDEILGSGRSVRLDRRLVQSDNPAYSDMPDCGLDEIECIGRVIWAGRKIA